MECKDDFAASQYKLKPFTELIHPYLLGKSCNTFCITEMPPRDKALVV